MAKIDTPLEEILDPTDIEWLRRTIPDPADGDLDERLDQLEAWRAEHQDVPAPTTPLPTPVSLDGARELASFRRPGKSDDDAIAAAKAWVLDARATQTSTPPLVAQGRWNQTQPVRMVDGLKFVNPNGVGSMQRSAESIPTDWRCSGPGPFFVYDQPTTFDTQFSGIGFQLNNGGELFATKPSCIAWTSLWRDLGLNGAKHGWGSLAQKFLNTACVWDGWMNFNNARNTQVIPGGSDTVFNLSNWLMDVGGNVGYRAEFAAAGAWLLDFWGQQKTSVIGGYLTVEGEANGIRVRNSASDGRLLFDRFVLEGRNGNAPNRRKLLQVDSGIAIVRDFSINYYAGSELAHYGAAILVGAGAKVQLHSPVVALAAGRVWNTPLVLVRKGGKLTVRDAERVGAGIDDPAFVIAHEAGAKIRPDDSVTTLQVA